MIMKEKGGDIVLKREYMIIVALTVVSILLGSLLYSNLAFGANGSSGSWGAIRFEEPGEVEVPVYPDNVTVAQFNWFPQDSSNNALFSITPYLQYRNESGAAEITLWVKLCDYNGNVWTAAVDFDCYEEWRWTAEPIIRMLVMPEERSGFPINQPSYNFTVEAYASFNTAYVRNVNLVIVVADGMVPNEYYKVELPSEGVGGLTIPVDKFSLLAPYIALVSTVILAVSISLAYIKYKKKQ